MALLSLERSRFSIKQESKERVVYVVLAFMVFLGKALTIGVCGACVLVSED